jgi:hypothetical protein
MNPADHRREGGAPPNGPRAGSEADTARKGACLDARCHAWSAAGSRPINAIGRLRLYAKDTHEQQTLAVMANPRALAREAQK